MTKLNRRGLVKLSNAPFLSRTELAAKLGISRQWLYDLLFYGKEPSEHLAVSLNTRIEKLLAAPPK